MSSRAAAGRFGLAERLRYAPAPMPSDIATVLEFRTEFDATPDRVFAALTEARHLEHWLCDSAESHAANGGRLLLRWSRADGVEPPFEARWVVFEPPMACAYEGGNAGYPDGYAGRIGFELGIDGVRTVLITRHRLPARPDYVSLTERHRHSWPRALARLTDYLSPIT